MNIHVDDLRRIFDSLIAHLERTGQESVEIPWDFYWEISRDQRYNPYSDPENPTLGQLFDDWSDLLKIANGEAPAVGYALVWLSSILRAVGETANP